MKNEKQIVLFLKKNTEYNPTQLGAKINQKFNNLGLPIILPNNYTKDNQPLIIFNQGILNMTITINDVSFTFLEKNKNDIADLLIDIVSFLEDNELNFNRMGYVSSYYQTKKEREFFKDKMIKEKNKICNDFQIAWYEEQLIDSVKVNFWERHLTDFYNNVEFLTIFDINTPVDQDYNINSYFLQNFLKKCDKFLELKIKEFTK